MRLPKNMDLGILYYLGGPMTGYPNYNQDAFEKAMKDLENAGLQIESPHTNPWPGTPLGTDQEIWQYFMKLAINQLLSCDGIILLKGFTSSRGALLEAQIAANLQMPMYFLDGEFLVAMHREKE